MRRTWLLGMAIVAGVGLGLSGCDEGIPREPASAGQPPAQTQDEAPDDDGATTDEQADPAAERPAGGSAEVAAPGIGPREQSLIMALGEHIDALNALDQEAFLGRYLDDCGGAAAAGGLAWGFGAPLVEAGGVASRGYASIRFVADDLALVEYEAQLPDALWVVHEGAWRISTCPEPGAE